MTNPLGWQFRKRRRGCSFIDMAYTPQVTLIGDYRYNELKAFAVGVGAPKKIINQCKTKLDLVIALRPYAIEYRITKGKE